MTETLCTYLNGQFLILDTKAWFLSQDVVLSHQLQEGKLIIANAGHGNTATKFEMKLSKKKKVTTQTYYLVTEQ